VDITQIQTFLALAEELHFGRTAERLCVSQSMISRRIAALESQLGGTLVERTSRMVRLTPLGERLEAGLRPAYQQLIDASTDARATAKGTSGVLNLGFAPILSTEPVTEMADEFERRHPGCRIVLHEHVAAGQGGDIWKRLRDGQSDALYYFNDVSEPGLRVGPVIEYKDRVLLVGKRHRLAGRTSVTAEELAGEQVVDRPPSLPASIMDQLAPSATPSGRPIHRAGPAPTSFMTTLTLVARGHGVHPTVAGMAMARRDGILSIPLEGLPPVPVGLIWSEAHENARIRALAEVARSVSRAWPR
jgi:DNA-binding transcriptional LysR family regulator